MTNGQYLYVSLYKLREDITNLLSYLSESDCPNETLIGKLSVVSDVLDCEFKKVDSILNAESDNVCKSSEDS